MARGEPREPTHSSIRADSPNRIGVDCPKCDHRFTVPEALKIQTPQFLCPSCRAPLTLDRFGRRLFYGMLAAGALNGLVISFLWIRGSWSLAECLVLFLVLVALAIPGEMAVLRFVSAEERPEKHPA